MKSDVDGNDVSDVLHGKEYIESYRETEMVHLSSYVLTTNKSSKPKESYDMMICPVGSDCGCDKLEFTARDDSVEGKKIYLNLYTAISNIRVLTALTACTLVPLDKCPFSAVCRKGPVLLLK